MDSLNYFAANEQEAQERFKERRDRWFRPIVELLVFLRITPICVSIWGMLFLVPFVYIVVMFPDPLTIAYACIFIGLHILFDGVDGPLARRLGVASSGGALVDMCCDHGGMVIVTWVLSWVGLIDGTIGNVYVFLYTIAIVFIVWLNGLGRPFQFVFRSKYFFFLLILVFGLTGWNILNESLLFFSACNLLLCCVGFHRIRSALNES